MNPLRNRILFSEKKRENNFFNKMKINNSIDKKINYSTILDNYYKIDIDKAHSEKQLSFDEKSENYLFSNEKDNRNNIDIDIDKYSNENKNENKFGDNDNKKDKKENDDNFNYDLPLEMDKTSEIFNFIWSQKNNSENINNINNINIKEINKFQDNNNNNNRQLNIITFNIKKKDNNSNDHNNNMNECSDKYFSFDGDTQNNEENNKSKNNKEKLKEKNNYEEEDEKIHHKNDKDNNDKYFDSYLNDNNNLLDKDNKYLDSYLNDNNNVLYNENNSLNNSLENNNNLSNDNNLSNNKYNNDNNKNHNLILTPKKNLKKKLNLLLQSEEKKLSKDYFIENDKKLINKNLIGYLAFNTSNSLKSKSSIMNDDSFSYSKNRENSVLPSLYPSKRLIYDNMNDSIDKLNKNNNSNININEKIIKININNQKKSIVKTPNINQKELSINIQFNNYLNRSRNNNNLKRSLTKNDKVFKFSNKDKTLPNKILNYTQKTFNSFIDLKNLNKISKIKNKHSIKYSPKHKKNISSSNEYNNSYNNNSKSRNKVIEYSNTSEDINLYKTVNSNNNISNKILINKRNNTLKSIPLQKTMNIIKVNKINNNKKSNSIKKVLNKYENNNNNNNNSLPFANSTKTLKARNKTLYSLNLETLHKNDKQLFTHKTSKTNHTNNIKNKIETFKKINERFGSYDDNLINNYNNCTKNKIKKEVFNKKKIISKTKISLDANIKKKLNLFKNNNCKTKNLHSRNYNNEKNLYIKNKTIHNKFLTTYQSQNWNELKKEFNKEYNKEEVSNYQKNKNIENKNKVLNIPFSKKININKGNLAKINNSIINKRNNSKNKLKKSDYSKHYINNNNNKKNKINKIISPKTNKYLFNYVEIKPSINIIDKDIITYSILRNNKNNKISQAFSLTLGKEDNTNINKDKNDEQQSLITNNELQKDSNKKTIINVNQYCPNYYFSTNNSDKTS